MRHLVALLRTGWTGIRAHRARSTALVATVAAGTALVLCALVLGATMKSAVDQAIHVEYAGTDLVVDSPTDGGDLEQLAAIDGVAEVSGIVRTTAVAQVQGAGRGIVLESLAGSRALQWQRFARGRAPEAPLEVALTHRTLAELGIRVGDQVALGRAGTGRENFTVVGELDVRGSARYTTTAFGVVTAAAARELADTTGSTAVLVALADGAQPADVAERIEEGGLGPVRDTGELAAESVGEPGALLEGLDPVVDAFTGAAVLLAALLLGSLAVTTAAARRRAAALLRNAGGTRGDVVTVALVESVLLGLVGAVLGVGLGLGLAHATGPVLSLVPGLPRFPSGALTVPAGAVAVPLVGGVALAVLAGLVPVLLAVRGSAADALRRATTPVRRVDALLPISAVGVGLLGLGGFLVLDGAEHVLVASAAVLVGSLLLLPILVRVAARFVLRTRAVRRSAARSLAGARVAEHPTRAAGEAVVLALACALVTFTWVGLGSVAESAQGRLDASGTVDLALGSPTGAPLPDPLMADLDAVAGVTQVVPIQFGAGVHIEGRVDGRTVRFEAGTMTAEPEDLDEVLPQPFVLRELEDDAVYLRVGDSPFEEGATVTLRGPLDSRPDLRVVLVEDLPVPSMVNDYLMKWATLDTEPRMAWLSVAPGADRERVLEETTAVAWLSGDAAATGAIPQDLRVTGTVAAARSVAHGMLAIALLAVVAGLVLVTGSAVRERGAEHALLRAVGLERSSLRKLVMTRLLVVGGVGAVVGAVVGAALGVLCSRAIVQGLGLVPDLAVPWLPILVALALLVLIVRTACVLPIERVFVARPARELAVD